MKRIYTLFILLTSVVIGTTSCNKTFTCECKSQGTVVASTPIKDLGKGGAKNVCDSYQVQNNKNGGNQVCSLK